MRALIALVAVLAVVLPSAQFAPAIAQATLNGAVMQVVVANPGEGIFLQRGTAFHAGNGSFYTSAHVVKSPRIPSGYTNWYLAGTTSTRSPNTWLPVTVDCIHPYWRAPTDATMAQPYDIARLKASGGPSLPGALTISSRMPAPGMRVRIAGFPAASRGWPPVMYTASGHIIEVYLQNQNMLIELESGFVFEGSSGSPVLTDDDAVVGILYGGEVISQPRTPGSYQIAMMIQAMRSMCP